MIQWFVSYLDKVPQCLWSEGQLGSCPLLPTFRPSIHHHDPPRKRRPIQTCKHDQKCQKFKMVIKTISHLLRYVTYNDRKITNIGYHDKHFFVKMTNKITIEVWSHGSIWPSAFNTDPHLVCRSSGDSASDILKVTVLQA